MAPMAGSIHNLLLKEGTYSESFATELDSLWGLGKDDNDIKEQ